MLLVEGVNGSLNKIVAYYQRKIKSMKQILLYVIAYIIAKPIIDFIFYKILKW